jgi:hypothetical protein
MHQAARLQFERIASEYASWRAVPEQERLPSPAWWWGPAMDALNNAEAMAPQLCAMFELPADASYGAAAGLLMTALAGQTSPGRPDDFPKMPRQADLP